MESRPICWYTPNINHCSNCDGQIHYERLIIGKATRSCLHEDRDEPLLDSLDSCNDQIRVAQHYRVDHGILRINRRSSNLTRLLRLPNDRLRHWTWPFAAFQLLAPFLLLPLAFCGDHPKLVFLVDQRLDLGTDEAIERWLNNRNNLHHLVVVLPYHCLIPSSVNQLLWCWG